MRWFSKLYERSFYCFIVIYVLEFFLACVIYFYLPDVIPLHIGLNSVDLWGKGKFAIFFLPVLLIGVSYISKSNYVDRKYLPGTSTTLFIKIFLFAVQLLCMLGSINYFYILLMLIFKGSAFFN
ncbi:DUF1648 domain-containing protein [Liquorilactobacillus satsumensis]|nr:DUF1648 domain-containing protein [Liquorilactobacillus satsumensis]MCP9328879.1 DUF1648 domain-containing protein [Liquorilactobacillus satsumensis]MCP9356775.1 DUF1648 domain-containing protein [Liquorilactobacillus satsumensis]MCP9360329.1 DUF1648 domain-containing protein [Liquorilactobacillus satsumensis]MCP9370715.1 DUF1648 domain-containing protein [Liquorilactobacillus satsumensis]